MKLKHFGFIFLNLVIGILIFGSFLFYGWAQGAGSVKQFQEFQLIPTNGAIDVEFFTIDDNQFLVWSNHFDGTTYNLDSIIYRWDGTSFVEFQSIPTSGAFEVELFAINNNYYLAVANAYDGSSYNIDSKIYQWDGTSFVEFQSIPTSHAIDWEFFTIDSNYYLALANMHNGSSYNIDSKIYQWDGTIFVEFQSIPTNGARDWEFFTIDSNYYLAVANARNDSTRNINAKIYQWNGTSFIEFQSIPTNEAIDWEFFTIDSNYYLAVSNGSNNSTYNINSKIYQWDGTSFVEFQSIPTSRAREWEFFTIDSNYYLAITNTDNDSTRNVNAKIYQWDGTSFVEFQSIPTNGAIGVAFFTLHTNSYLAIAHHSNDITRNINSKVYKMVNYSNTELFGITGNYFVGIDRVTGDATEISYLAEEPVFTSLTFDPEANSLYGISDGDSIPKLFSIDLETGQVDIIGFIALPDHFIVVAEGLTFNPINNTLYGAIREADGASNRLVTIDPSTGAATQIAEITGTVNDEANDLVFINNVLYAVDSDGVSTFLYKIDLNTGVATLIGEIGFSDVDDLTYNIQTQMLFGFSRNQRVLITISPVTGQGTLVGTTHTPIEFDGETMTAIVAVYDVPDLTIPKTPINVFEQDIVQVPIQLNDIKTTHDLRGIQFSLNVADTQILSPATFLTPTVGTLFPPGGTLSGGTLFPSGTISSVTATSNGWDFLLTAPLSPTAPFSGTGVVVTLPFIALDAGCTTLTFEYHILSDSNTQLIPHIVNDATACVAQGANVAGNIYLDWRHTDHHTDTQVYLMGDLATYTTTTNAQGNIVLNQIYPGSYTVQASHPLFAAATRSLTIVDGITNTLSSIGLWAGDIDQDQRIDLYDWYLLNAANYPVSALSFDINDDGKIDIDDLVILNDNRNQPDITTNPPERPEIVPDTNLIFPQNSTAGQLNLVEEAGQLYIQLAQVNSPVCAMGAKINLPTEANITQVEAQEAIGGGFLQWSQTETQLYIVVAPAKDTSLNQLTNLATIQGVTLNEVSLEATNIIPCSQVPTYLVYLPLVLK